MMKVQSSKQQSHGTKDYNERKNTMKNKTIASIISVLVEKLVRAEKNIKILKRQKRELKRELAMLKADLEAQKALSKLNGEMVKALNTCKDITY